MNGSEKESETKYVTYMKEMISIEFNEAHINNVETTEEFDENYEL